MSTFAVDPQRRTRPSREAGLALAEERKAARRRRTGRIRKTVAVVAVAAFIGPFSVIYTQMADGPDPATAKTESQAKASAPAKQRAAATSGSTTTSTPAPVTTSQS